MNLEPFMSPAKIKRQKSNQAFLKRLQREASAQAELEKHRLLPSGLDPLTSAVGKYSWQILLLLSGLTSLMIEIMKWMV